MTADLFTRLAHRALGDGGLTMLPDPEPEPPRDEDIVEPGYDADTPLAPDAPRTVDAMRTPAGADTPLAPDAPRTVDAMRPPAEHVVADPVSATPVLLRVPEAPPSPVPVKPAPATPQPMRMAAGAVALVPPPAEARRDDVPADAAAGQPGPRPAILEPLPLPVIEPPAAPPDRQPTQAADSGTSVEVTVGRIEIRVRPPAQSNTAGSRPAVSPPPALTLGDYLRSREASP